ncbi:MAG: hypothetical protein COB49_07360 [Alphaproteobacteria bacterium]|nr:MAG: hypothetical protein COB49_07360 [Alphaproteobacteria bacterium]
MWSLNKSKSPARRGVTQRLKRRRHLSLFLRSLSLVVVSISVISAAYFWKSGLFGQWVMEARDTVDRRIADAGFTINEVRVTGQENTSLKQVHDALALYDGQSIVSLDLDKILEQVEALPWVKMATVIKIMPDALAVAITEHEAAALWQKNGKFYLVNKAGKIITDRELEKYAFLPHVVGKDANENLTGLLAMKDKYPDLFAKVKSAVWIGRRRWNLNLAGGIKIKLPEKGADLAWDRLYDYQTRQKILTRDVLVIDFCQQGKTIVRLTPQEAQRRRLLKKFGNKQESI